MNAAAPPLAATRGLRLPGGILLAALAVYAAAVADSYELRLLGMAGCYALMTLGYQFIFGHAGGLSLAQGTFFGVGAYVSGLLGAKLGVPFVLGFPAAVAGATLLAAVIALPVIRLQSHYLALATLGISQVVLLGAVDWVSLTGGGNGVPGVPPVGVAGIGPAGDLSYTAFVWVWVAAGAALAAWLLHARRLGPALHLLRDEPEAAGALGLNLPRLRFAALLLSAAYGGAAGSLFVHGIGVASPDTLQFETMVACLCMAVIGGRTHLLGAIVGAVLLVNLPEWFRFLEHWALLAYGGALLLVILVAPDGLVGLADALWRRVWPARRSPPAAGPLPAPGSSSARATGLVKRFGGVVALDGVSADIAAGEIVGLIGPNGSGKTTLLNCLGGQYPVDAGTQLLDSQPITRLPPWRRAELGLARTFQGGDAPSAEPLAARAALAAAARSAGSAGSAGADAIAMAALARVGLDSAWDQAAGALPLAARRRAEIAQALAMAPGLLLLDEPAAGLTAAEQADLAVLLRDLNGAGLTLLIADHNMAFLLPLATRLICLDAGRVVAAGDPRQVTRDPHVIAAYLGRRHGGDAP